MSAAQTISSLAGFSGRGPGSESERRAALWLAQELRAGGREVRLEPFWCRPNWALAHSWHVVLGLAGSLVSVSSPRIGAALVLIALLSVIADSFVGVSPGRRLTRERASQNVVGTTTGDHDAANVRLIISANYDAGLAGLAYRDRFRAACARLRRSFGDRGPGWLGWVALALLWLLVVAILRLEGSRGTAIGAAQLPATVFLVLALALLLELGTSDRSPAAGDNGSGVAAALALVRALDVAPPAHVDVEIVLAGAGDGPGIGLRQHLRAGRPGLTPRNTIVVGIGPCAQGAPRWWVSDGPLVPLSFFARLRELCARVAEQEPHLAAAPHRGRGSSPALPARIARVPAITIGALDKRGCSPRSHQRSDTPEAVDPAAVDRVVHLGLLLTDAIDEYVGAASSRPATPARSVGG